MIHLGVLMLAVGLAACGGARNRVAPAAGDDASSELYSYDVTAPHDTAFTYAQSSGPNVFEWKTVTMRFEPQTIFEGNRLKFLFDVVIENGGTRNFNLEDYSAYVALPDGNGEWNYRMLFTQSKASSIPPKGRTKVRYFTQLYGLAPPDNMVFVMQTFFGGHDAGFSFTRRPR